MVLESDIECLSKAIHVIVFSVKPAFHIGRRVSNDITISDISVSRVQASITLKNDRIYVEDCDSKFGTFIKVLSTIAIPLNFKLPIQIEKKIFFFKLENRFSCFQQCLFSWNIISRSQTESNEDGDHYQQVYDKYPKELENIFIVVPDNIVSVKPSLDNSLLRGAKNYNKVIDESMITQMSAGDLQKLRNNLNKNAGG